MIKCRVFFNYFLLVNSILGQHCFDFELEM